MAQSMHYQVAEGWAQLPEAWSWGWIVAIACDSQDRVFIYSRSQHPLVVLDRQGNFLQTWGEGVLAPGQAHGLFIDAQDNVYCTDVTAHAVYKFDRHGHLQFTLGTPGQAGAGDGDPFNRPTDLAVSSQGELFVSDGYGNARVHKYSAQGELLLSWGERGTGPGQFGLSHCVRVDRHDRVWVCDRSNNRIQLFDTDGHYLEERTGLLEPNSIFFHPKEDMVFVAELGHRVSIYTLDGQLINKWGGGRSSTSPGEFLGGAHGIWMDSHGDLYVGEVVLDVNGRMQKFVLQT